MTIQAAVADTSTKTVTFGGKTYNIQALSDDSYTVLLAGGGVTGGAVYGASDRIGAYPAADPVTPGDLAATIFWRFGIDPATEIRDRGARPYRVASGDPIRRLFGE